MSTRASYSELATALAFVLQKWKDAGAPEADAKAFDELLARVRDEPTEIPAQPLVKGNRPFLDGDYERTQRRPSNNPRLAELDAHIDELNREAD